MIINRTDYQKVAAAEYAAGGMDAIMKYLHGLVRSHRTNPAGATHILVWTVPGDVLDAYWEEKEEK